MSNLSHFRCPELVVGALDSEAGERRQTRSVNGKQEEGHGFSIYCLVLLSRMSCGAL